jgi:hypothetical protein
VPLRLELPAWAPPAATAAAALAGCVTIGLVDPSVPGRYPTCPFLLVTGRWCPGCGSLRATRALLEGRPLAALDLNPLMVLAVPYLLYSWLAWAAPRMGGPALPVLRPGHRTILGILVLVLVFWVARNLPWAPFTILAPAA